MRYILIGKYIDSIDIVIKFYGRLKIPFFQPDLLCALKDTGIKMNLC